MVDNSRVNGVYPLPYLSLYSVIINYIDIISYINIINYINIKKLYKYYSKSRWISELRGTMQRCPGPHVPWPAHALHHQGRQMADGGSRNDGHINVLPHLYLFLYLYIYISIYIYIHIGDFHSPRTKMEDSATILLGVS